MQDGSQTKTAKNCIKPSTTEEWRPIVGWEGLYEVSSIGRVRSVDRVIECADGPKRYKGRMRSLSKDGGGYPQVILSYKGEQVMRKVHALVMEAFVGQRPEGMQICHGDGDQTNNRVGNLRYGTGQENCADTLKHGRRPLGINHKRSKLTDDEVREIRSLRGSVTQQKLADRFGVHRVHISAIQSGKYWGHLKDDRGATA